MRWRCELATCYNLTCVAACERLARDDDGFQARVDDGGAERVWNGNHLVPQRMRGSGTAAWLDRNTDIHSSYGQRACG